MLAGIKFVPRDQLLSKNVRSGDEEDDEGEEEKKLKKDDNNNNKKDRWSRKSSSNKNKKKHKSHYNSSGKEEKDSDGTEKRRKWRKKSKHYSSDDESSFDYSSDEEDIKKGKRRGRQFSYSSDSLEDNDESKGQKGKRTDKGKSVAADDGSEGLEEAVNQNDNELSRKEMGLEWMLSSGKKRESDSKKVESEPKENIVIEEVTGTNPRELNPFLKENGSGYPDDGGDVHTDKLFPTSVVGDGGASWRLKAWKRAKEQAAREGQKLNEVVKERWGSLGQLVESVAASRVAPAHAHLHAIRDRKKGPSEGAKDAEVNEDSKEVNRGKRDYLRDVSVRNPEMKKPKHDALAWRKNKNRNISSEDASLISSAMSGLNKFANDGSFMDEIARQQRKNQDLEIDMCKEKGLLPTGSTDTTLSYSVGSQALSENQLAAKILQLRMKGKHDEADKLSNELERRTERHGVETKTSREDGSSHRYLQNKVAGEHKRKEDDADLHLAQKIIQNKQYSLSGRADDEYDFGDAPSRKRNRKKDQKPEQKRSMPQRFRTQQERCQFCFESPSRTKHLVVAIANFTYLMLPQWQPVVHGHCCILPMQHDSSTRTVEETAWQEIRNFKKCLIMMFSKQEKDVVFMETVVGLSQQRRHCLIECIPVPSEIAKQAPLYFKKAIDEAEDEWGQHEMKKLIPTSGNLRHVIPENFAYFHVEFGLDRGFVHVIDDDSNFKSGFGLNVIRGLLRLPEEDMHRRRRQEPVEKQKQAVADFAREWDPFDWTKQLD